MSNKKIVMKQIIKRGSFLTLMFMLLGCLSLYAADNDLTTKQITIKLKRLVLCLIELQVVKSIRLPI